MLIWLYLIIMRRNLTLLITSYDLCIYNNNNGYFKCYFSREHIALSLKNDVNIKFGRPTD